MHPLLLALLILIQSSLAVAAGTPAGETVIKDLKNTKIIRSNEQPHQILNEACLACHPKDKFNFWLLIYKGKQPSVLVESQDGKPGLQADGTGSKQAPVNKYNSHETLACSFCHFDNPTATTAKFIMEIPDLCRLCHPGMETHNMPEGEQAKSVAAGIEAGKLPGREGKILCTTCHKLHDSIYGMREAYARIVYEGKIPNPHGNRFLCFACHPGKIKEGTEVPLGEGRDIEKLCNSCHGRPGVPKAPHVVGVTSSSESTWRMDYLGYPLEQGKLICTTCHDEVSHRKPDPANPRFLRGGPYAEQDQFCYRCHLEDKDQLSNPHRQIDPFGRIRIESCRFCHKKDPDLAKPRNPKNLEMVGEEVSICSNCHPDRPHPDRDHNVAMSGEKLARKVAYEQRHQVTLPLGDGDMVRCSTCHNPHAKGVLKGESGVGAGSKWRVPDFREVCAPCHGRF
ncbi:MAG TPA: hypothetical protein VGK27_11185 [Candidatus Deferrimicrobiaceae bacterium]